MSIRALTLTAMIAAMVAVPALRASAQDAKPDWREMNAYALGVQAYIYTFPWSYMTDQRWFRSADVNHQANQLYHFRDLKDASHVDGGSPNNDTLYSRSWLYLKDEPIILSVPAISDRYHSVELTDYMDDNFAYAGTHDGRRGRNLRDRGARLEGFAAGRGDGAAALVDAVGVPPGTHRRHGRVRSGGGARDPGQV
jgi:hypothetical protein